MRDYRPNADAVPQAGLRSVRAQGTPPHFQIAFALPEALTRFSDS